jgi:hypothetical protein
MISSFRPLVVLSLLLSILPASAKQLAVDEIGVVGLTEEKPFFQTEKRDFSHPEKLVYWRNGTACGQSLRAIKSLLKTGYLPDKEFLLTEVACRCGSYMPDHSNSWRMSMSSWIISHMRVTK